MSQADFTHSPVPKINSSLAQWHFQQLFLKVLRRLHFHSDTQGDLVPVKPPPRLSAKPTFHLHLQAQTIPTDPLKLTAPATCSHHSFLSFLVF